MSVTSTNYKKDVSRNVLLVTTHYFMSADGIDKQHQKELWTRVQISTTDRGDSEFPDHTS